MLPKINQKGQGRDNVAYQSFTRQIMALRTDDNNISKLKMIKNFLEDEQNYFNSMKAFSRPQKQSRRVDQSLDFIKMNKIRENQQKQNQTKTRKTRRQSLTSEIYRNQKQIKSVQKQKTTIFAMPERFKLNQLLFSQVGVKKQGVKNLLQTSMKMNNQFYTHRIL